MLDRFDREVDYLRISVTDLCNYRCSYCMPKNGIIKKEHNDIISFERIVEIVTSLTSLGIKKIRLTGGEPLLRNGIIDLCKMLKNIKGVEELCITTNASLLKKYAKDLFEAGVSKLNISLDTLKEGRYKLITRGANLSDVLEGIKEAKRVGFKNIKINCVLIGGFNDDEIIDFAKFANDYDLEFRFIELMPIGEAIHYPKEAFISSDIVLEKLPNLIPLKFDGVTSIYGFKNDKGRIGLISPLSHTFCHSCSRIRLTSDGKIKPCLHSSLEIDLANLHGEELNRKLEEAIFNKPKMHLLKEKKKSDSSRLMSEIGG